MTFDEVLVQVRELLEHEGRVAYRILKRRFELDDEDLEDLKADLIDAKRVAVDEEGKVLVWTGGTAKEETENRRIGESEKVSSEFGVWSLSHPQPSGVVGMWCWDVGSGLALKHFASLCGAADGAKSRAAADLVR